MAAVLDHDRTWKPSDQRRDRTMHLCTDADSAAAMDKVIGNLVLLGAPMWLGDPGPTVSVLVSLAVDADVFLYDVVADTRTQGHSCSQLPWRADTTVATARYRYCDHSRWRSEAWNLVGPNGT